MWGTTSGNGSDSAAHLLIPDHTAVRLGQRGTDHLELAREVLLPIGARQSLQAHFVSIKIQMSKGFGQTIQ